MKEHFLNHIELWLSALGLLIVWVVPSLLLTDVENVWKVAAVTAVVVSVLHGLIFWIVKQQRRKVLLEAKERVERQRQVLEERV